YFTRETDLPMTIGMLVDTSKSQERLIDIEKRAAYEFFSKVLRKKDLAFLMQFGAEAELLQDETNSPRLLQEGLNQLRLSVPVEGDGKTMQSGSGGHVNKVDRSHSLDQIFKELQDEMRSQYSIGYSSTNPKKDGTFRKIEIRTASKDLKVQTRKGYYAIDTAN